MKLALIGYGKMGRAIETIALERGHEIVLKISSDNRKELTPDDLRSADAAIEFTHPESAVENILLCLQARTPVVCGSTGWLQHWNSVQSAVQAEDGALLYASNFSVGVNIFFEINKKLAALMNNRPDYEVSLKEIHHTAKKDAPSGTAITLAEQVMAAIPRKTQWTSQPSAGKNTLAIESIRQDPAPGTHSVLYHSAIDDIEIIHTAHNRQGFAMGAVLAAEFLSGKKGIFTMQDVLGL